ncbi:MAG: elongation factor Ts [Clostridiales bacterium]|nr:elongation factor Ts [Clostridiales bacterium]
MAITASMVKELRTRTGAGMMDCKKVLVETDGDMDAAIKLMREKGMAKAAKKAGRVAAEGLVKAVVADGKAAIVEVNSETDFVSKNDSFVAFVENVAKQALNTNADSIESFMSEAWHLDTSKDVLTVQTEHIAQIGENLNIRRFKVLDLGQNAVAAYIHGGGKIGVLVEVEGANGDAIVEAARNIAMQVAATNPKYVSRDDVDQEFIAAETEVLTSQALNEGKPAAIVEKMVQGRVQKMLKEICLLDQPYVKDDDFTVASYLKSVDANAKLANVIRFETGEGIEKKEENFAEEVAKQIKG